MKERIDGNGKGRDYERPEPKTIDERPVEALLRQLMVHLARYCHSRLPTWPEGLIARQLLERSFVLTTKTYRYFGWASKLSDSPDFGQEAVDEAHPAFANGFAQVLAVVNEMKFLVSVAGEVFMPKDLQADTSTFLDNLESELLEYTSNVMAWLREETRELWEEIDADLGIDGDEDGEEE